MSDQRHQYVAQRLDVLCGELGHQAPASSVSAVASAVAMDS